MGKLSNNSVYYGKSGYLLQKFQEPGEQFQKNPRRFDLLPWAKLSCLCPSSPLPPPPMC